MSRRRGALALLLGLLPGLAACSTVPLETATVQITQVPDRPAREVGIEPFGPEPGATPEQVVRGFIEAAASTIAGRSGRGELVRSARADRGRVSRN